MLASFLPRDFDDEKSISLYEQSAPLLKQANTNGFHDNSNNVQHSPSVDVHDNQMKLKRKIRLRNHLLDVLMSHFTTEMNEFDIRYVYNLCVCTCMMCMMCLGMFVCIIVAMVRVGVQQAFI